MLFQFVFIMVGMSPFMDNLNIVKILPALISVLELLHHLISAMEYVPIMLSETIRCSSTLICK